VPVSTTPRWLLYCVSCIASHARTHPSDVIHRFIHLASRCRTGRLGHAWRSLAVYMHCTRRARGWRELRGWRGGCPSSTQRLISHVVSQDVWGGVVLAASYFRGRRMGVYALRGAGGGTSDGRGRHDTTLRFASSMRRAGVA
jgi:hypothetical protein